MIIFSSVYRGIADHFPIRRSEWIMLLPAFGMWAAFSVTPDVFDKSSSFARMAAWADESIWAIILLAVGVLRLAALTVNGTFHQFRFSPHLRALASLVGLVFWSQWTLAIIDAFLREGGSPTGIVAYGTFCALELANLSTSATDIGGEIKRIVSRPSQASERKNGL